MDFREISVKQVFILKYSTKETILMSQSALKRNFRSTKYDQLETCSI